MAAATSLKKEKKKKPTKKKLTLSLNEEVIKLGKNIAREQGVSLSKFFEQYILEITKTTTEHKFTVEPDAELGALFPPRKRLPEDYDLKRDYTDYYEAKNKEYVQLKEA